MKDVQDTKAGKSISAWVIINKKGECVAIVQAHFADGGTVSVNVWDKTGKGQHGKGHAGGYGYDKLVAALRGLHIDGIELKDHSSGFDDPILKKLLAKYPKPTTEEREMIARKYGARFANWQDGAYHSLYYSGGLDRLTDMGYKVIQAI